MATKWRLKKEAEKKNREEVNKREYWYYELARFTKQALGTDSFSYNQPSGNTLLVGDDQMRRKLLLEIVKYFSSIEIPTVIINSGPSLKEALERMDIPHYYTSQEVRNYDYFLGWTNHQIADHLYNIDDASATQEQKNDIFRYINAVELLYNVVSLKTMTWKQRNHDFVDAVFEEMNSRPDFITTSFFSEFKTMKNSSRKDYINFILYRFCEDAKFQCRNDKPGISLLKNPPLGKQVYLIEIDEGINPEPSIKYFKAEFSRTGRFPFHLILSDCSTASCADWFREMLDNRNRITISLPSIAPIWHEDKLGNYEIHNLAYLNAEDKSARVMPLGVKRTLELFGGYDQWNVSEGGSSPPEFFSFWTGSFASSSPLHKAAVTPEQANKYNGILYGQNRTEIAMVKCLL